MKTKAYISKVGIRESAVGDLTRVEIYLRLPDGRIIAFLSYELLSLREARQLKQEIQESC
jgi:hypothetical protein